VLRLERQKDFRPVQELPFCYWCGRSFQSGEEPSRDHVPAQACFAIADRNFPLWLPAHDECNGQHKVEDELLGQLIGLRRREAPKPKNRRLKLRFFQPAADQPLIGGITNLDVHAVVQLWLRAFHAALYHEPLPPRTQFAIETPFPMARLDGDRVEQVALRAEQHRLVVETLKRERAADNLDRIRCNNGKLLYECVWDQFDDGTWLCAFGVDLYGWADLGDTRNFERRGCAGGYFLPERTIPARATRALNGAQRFRNESPLDPFGE
jgi:hypothetical protein